MKRNLPQNTSTYESKEILAFASAFIKIYNTRFTSINELENKYYNEWMEYVSSVKGIIPIMLNSVKPVFSEKKDDDGNNIVTSNKSMVMSLRDSGFMKCSYKDEYIEDELFDEIFLHIIMRTDYIFKKAQNAKSGYNLISVCVTNKLIDMCRLMNRWKRDFNLLKVIETSQVDELKYEVADSKVNIEEQVLNRLFVEYACDNILHENISILKRHPDRLIAYIAEIHGYNEKTLYNRIKRDGYFKTMVTIARRLKRFNIDISYLCNTQMNFKKESDSVTLNDIYSWRYRAKKDINAKCSNIKKHLM